MAAIRFSDLFMASTPVPWLRHLAADRAALAWPRRKHLQRVRLDLDRMLEAGREQILQMRDRAVQSAQRRIGAEHHAGLDQIDIALHDLELRKVEVAVEHPAIGRVENAAGRHLAAVAVDKGVVEPSVDAGDL